MERPGQETDGAAASEAVGAVDDPATEMLTLVRRLRGALEARARSGALGVPARKSGRRAMVAPPAALPVVGAALPTVVPATTIASRSSSPSPVPVSAPVVPVAELLAESHAGVVGAPGLALVREELGDCTRCRLSGGRKNLVFGVGNPEAHLVFVGEAPGADEDVQGEPFVGKAGQLLTKMIEAMGYAREDVYICNVIKCRPPGNRNPEPDEVAACEPFLKKQLAALRPRMIVALGKFAAQCLLRDDAPISRLRGNFRTYEGIPLMPTFHPAYLLREPARKKEAWHDLKQVIEALRRVGFEPPRPPAG